VPVPGAGPGRHGRPRRGRCSGPDEPPVGASGGSGPDRPVLPSVARVRPVQELPAAVGGAKRVSPGHEPAGWPGPLAMCWHGAPPISGGRSRRLSADIQLFRLGCPATLRFSLGGTGLASFGITGEVGGGVPVPGAGPGRHGRPRRGRCSGPDGPPVGATVGAAGGSGPDRPVLPSVARVRPVQELPAAVGEPSASRLVMSQPGGRGPLAMCGHGAPPISGGRSRRLSSCCPVRRRRGGAIGSRLSGQFVRHVLCFGAPQRGSDHLERAARLFGV